MIGYLAGAALAVSGVVVAVLVARRLPARWAPGVLGGVTGGFGIGSIRVAGHADMGLLALTALMIAYGLMIGAAVALMGRTP